MSAPASKPSSYYTIIHPEYRKKSQKVYFEPGTTIDAKEINDVVGGKYALFAAKNPEYCIAANSTIFLAGCNLPKNSKADKKANEEFHEICGTAVYIRMNDLKYIDGEKTQTMQEFIVHSYPNGHPRNEE
jgi:hypothetical protein